jgi:hypothetical protein
MNVDAQDVGNIGKEETGATHRWLGGLVACGLVMTWRPLFIAGLQRLNTLRRSRRPPHALTNLLSF